MATDFSPSYALGLFSTLIFVTLFPRRVMAQRTASPDQPPARAGGNDALTPSSLTPSNTPTAAQTSDDAQATPVVVVSSPVSDSPTSQRLTPNPTITRGPTATSGGELTGFPTLTRNAIPTYPPPAVPPTHDAPFMRHSNLPDGTVFIAVGAILGVFGLAILLYRAIVSLLLHRSVKRAAMAQHISNSKAGFPAPPAPFYKYTDQESTMSLGGAAGRGVRRTNRGPVPSATPSHSNLFFSPTAINNASGSRASTFLPSGFYGAGTGSGSSAALHGNSISLHNLRPDSRGHYANGSRHTLSGTPPDSPQYYPRRDGGATSASSLHINTGSSAAKRAPSAYLEDLLADDPVSLPPPPMPPSELPGSSAHSERTESLPGRI
ncbi:hypothetical protein XA68_16425 [Ophiocordyceps unilateralis]|uniref:Uncharacterized protein n=1 Tax=Ophiocordyceps unilateralis TaxID=268505 RepID=A0A2A9P5L6_OPHUN|nr:hypothetical protein XA68_16425 [Ophiocordyceps unilateralis]